MKVTLLLADAAQVVQGKLYILGGGWSITGPDPTPYAIAVKIDVPWLETNRRHRLELDLVDSDGQPVRVNDQPLVVSGEFEVGRPPGLPPGTPLDVVLAINIGPLPLSPGAAFVWRCSINGHSEEHWQLTFTTRPARGAQARAG